MACPRNIIPTVLGNNAFFLIYKYQLISASKRNNRTIWNSGNFQIPTTTSVLHIEVLPIDNIAGFPYSNDRSTLTVECSDLPLYIGSLPFYSIASKAVCFLFQFIAFHFGVVHSAQDCFEQYYSKECPCFLISIFSKDISFNKIVHFHYFY